MNFFKILMVGYCLILLSNLFAQNNAPYQYVSPKPASLMVSNETNIILRHSDIIDQQSLSASLIQVKGSESGLHSGDLILSDDDRTIVFNPDKAFAGNEEVKVILMSGHKKTRRVTICPEFSFSFTTAPIRYYSIT